jgi:hypothetical protein
MIEALGRQIMEPAPGAGRAVGYTAGVVAGVNPLTVTLEGSGIAVPASSFAGRLWIGAVVGCLWDANVLRIIGCVEKYPAWTTARSIVAGITQGTGVFPTFSVTRDMFRTVGSQCEWNFAYTGVAGVAGTNGQTLQLNLPLANALNAAAPDIDGLVLIYDPNGSGFRYNVMSERGPDANTVQFGHSTGQAGAWSYASFTTSWQIRGVIRFQWKA